METVRRPQLGPGLAAGLGALLLVAMGAAIWLMAGGDAPAWLAGLTGRDPTWARMVDDAKFQGGAGPQLPPL